MGFPKRDLPAKEKPKPQSVAPAPQLDDMRIMAALDGLRSDLGDVTKEQQDTLDRFMTSMRSEINGLKKTMAARTWKFDVEYNSAGDITFMRATPEN